jgi:tetratricopeptide (TPR) repeat protein
LGRGSVELPTIPDVRIDLGELYIRLGLTHKALSELVLGHDALRSDGRDRQLIARYERGLAQAYARQGNRAQALEHFKRIENDATLVDGRLLAEMAQLYLSCDETEKAASLLQRARRAQLSDEQQLTLQIVQLRLELASGRWREAVELVDTALPLIESAGLRNELLGLFLAIAARAEVFGGDLRQAGQRLERARRYQESLDAEFEVRRGIIELMLTSRQREAAIKAALAFKRRAEEHQRPYDVAWALLYIGQATIEQLETSRKALAQALESFEQLQSPLGRVLTRLAHVEGDLSSRDIESASKRLMQAAQDLEHCAIRWPRQQYEFLSSRLAFLQGEIKKSLRHLESARSLAEEFSMRLQAKRIKKVGDQLATQRA